MTNLSLEARSHVSARPVTLLVVFAVWLLHLTTAFTPSIHTWGIDYWSEIPVWCRIGMFTLAVITCFPRTVRFIERWAGPLIESRYFAVTGTVLVLSAFVLFRSRGLAYGDGYTFQELISSPQLPDLAGNLALMPGDLYVHWLFYHLIVLPLDGSARMAYAVLSALAGAMSLLACAHIARQLFPTAARMRWFVVAAACGSGTAAMWFGHVEAYSLANCAILWSIAYTLDGLRVARSLYAAWIVWLIAASMHVLAVALLPVLIVATIHHRRPIALAHMSRLRALFVTILGFAASGLAAMAVHHFWPGIVVPIAPTTDSTYTVFSTAHILDCLNLLVFCAPIGLLGLVAWITQRDDSVTEFTDGYNSDASVVLLAVAAASLWLFSFWVDPLIGAFRDWDLLGAFGIPFSLWGACVLIRQQPRHARFSLSWVAVGMLAISHTGVFVWTLQNEEAVMLRVNRLVPADIHYSASFHRGERLVPWADVLSRACGRDDLAKTHNQTRLLIEPQDPHAWHNLAMNYWKLQLPLKSHDAQMRSLELDPSVAEKWRELAHIRIELDDSVGACEAFERFFKVIDTSAEDRNLLAKLYIGVNRDESAIPLLQKSQRDQPERVDTQYLFGLIAERAGDSAVAIERYESAAKLGKIPGDIERRLRALQPATGGNP